jgi:hypothetical protein
MRPISAQVDIVAPPARVWEILTNVERWPDWTSTVISATRLDSGPLAIGSRARMIQPKLRPAVWQVTELDEAKRVFVWTARRPGVAVHGGHYISATPLGCHVLLTITCSGLFAPLAQRMKRKLIQEYLHTEAESLKLRSETWRKQRTGS